jgi:hypothetical protein
MSRDSKNKFPFWFSDWIGGTAAMSPAERGVYIDLLCSQWTEGPLSEEQALAAGRAEPELVRKVLAKKFHRNPNGSFQNNRMEQERKRSGKDKPPKALKTAQESLATLPGLEIPPPQETAVSVKSEPVMVFACRGEPKLWGLEPSRLEGWRQLYPGLDLMKELGKACAWLEANGAKTAKGMPKFLVNWLNRAVDGQGGKPQSFRQQDNQERNRVRLKLKLEQLGLSAEDAARLSRLGEAAAIEEAKRLMVKPKIQEVIPW